MFSGSLSLAMPSQEKLAEIKQLLNKPDQPEQALKRHNNHHGFSDWAEAAEMLLALVKLWSGEKSINFSGEMPELQILFTLHALVAGAAFPPQQLHTQLTLRVHCTNEARPPPTHWILSGVSKESTHQNRHTHSWSHSTKLELSAPRGSLLMTSISKSLCFFLVESKECLYVFTKSRKVLQEQTNEPWHLTISKYTWDHTLLHNSSRGLASTLITNTLTQSDQHNSIEIIPFTSS